MPDVARRDRNLSDPNTMRFGKLIAEDLDDGKSVKRLSITAKHDEVPKRHRSFCSMLT